MRFTAGGWGEKPFGSLLTFLDLISKMRRAISTSRIMRRSDGNEVTKCARTVSCTLHVLFITELLFPGLKTPGQFRLRNSYSATRTMY